MHSSDWRERDNTLVMLKNEAQALSQEIENETRLPTVDPVRQGAARLVDTL